MDNSFPIQEGISKLVNPISSGSYPFKKYYPGKRCHLLLCIQFCGIIIIGNVLHYFGILKGGCIHSLAPAAPVGVDIHEYFLWIEVFNLTTIICYPVNFFSNIL